MENKIHDIKKVTIRTAPAFGYQLAGNFGLKLEKDMVMPSQWPTVFPITVKQIAELPEIDKNIIVARRVSEAAQTMWKDMLTTALEIEKDIKLHPENYEMLDGASGNSNETVWRELSVELEQISGDILVTSFDDEDSAKENAYSILSPKNLTLFMIKFKDDYNNFAHEAREAIRSKKQIPAVTRLELICLINTSTQYAIKAINKKKITKSKV